ncbi:MAG: hypothetical protein WCW01_06165 [Gammaproteobacteria bacterium]
MRVLVFSRGDRYADTIERSCNKNNFFIVTDAAYTFSTSRFDYYLSSISDVHAAVGYTYFSDEELFNIVRRDRYLRGIRLKTALNYVYNITGQLINIFKSELPDMVYTHYPDSFTLDILFRIASRCNIRSCCPIGYALPNYFMQFDYINKVFYRRANQLKKLNLINCFATKPATMPFYFVTNRLIFGELLSRIRMVLGPLLMQARFLNPLNPDVKNRNFYAMCCATRSIPLKRLNIGDLNVRKYYSTLDDVKNTGRRKVIYISMHYYPEASIDYSSKSINLINHDKIVVDIIRNFSDKYIFIVKEHPVMYNLRNLKLYETIKGFKNTYLLNPTISYLDVIKKSDVVVSWGGSVGLEAPFYGKQTLNIIKPLYHIDGFDNYFSDYNDLMLSFESKVEDNRFNVEAYCYALREFCSWVLFEGDWAALKTKNKSEALASFARAFDQIL